MLTCATGTGPAGLQLWFGEGGLPELTHVHVGGSVAAAHDLLLLTHAHLLLFLLYFSPSCGSQLRLAPQPGPAQPIEDALVPRIAGLALQVPTFLTAAAGVRDRSGPAAPGLRAQVWFARPAALRFLVAGSVPAS